MLSMFPLPPPFFSMLLDAVVSLGERKTGEKREGKQEPCSGRIHMHAQVRPEARSQPTCHGVGREGGRLQAGQGKMAFDRSSCRRVFACQPLSHHHHHLLSSTAFSPSLCMSPASWGPPLDGRLFLSLPSLVAQVFVRVIPH
mmetsp:Transcript_52960/g.103590  ORF Transcript_52960/g.103590 Transcript_52960/m.103590 type:complete len:142 (-) Transcript_52960:444-869(-)